MDSLPEDEIEAIWERVKSYLDLTRIKSVSRGMVRDEIENAMLNARVSQQKNPQSTMDFLVDRGFPYEAVKNQKVINELLTNNVKDIRVKGKLRFIIKKGTPTFRFQGKKIKAGQFLSGRTQDEAVESLKKKGQFTE